jgi:DNA-binding beta-propeller fold protein YncE
VQGAVKRAWCRGGDVLVVLLGVLLLLVGCESGGDGDNQDTPPAEDVAFVITMAGTTGSYSVVDLPTRDTFNDIDLGGLHSDAIARVFNGQVYVVNRLNQDNIQRIDPQRDYETRAQESVGNGSNPQDIVVVSADKAYVSRLAHDELLIIDPATLEESGTIDLSSLTKNSDTDDAPEAYRMLIHDGLVYLILQHLDNFLPVGIPGEVVVINPATDTIETVIELNGTNPFSDLQYSPDLDRILVSVVGKFAVSASGGGNDGGIVAIDPATRMVDAGFVIDEATIGGDITHFAVVSSTLGFAIVADDAFDTSLVSFNPSTGQRLQTLVEPPSDGFLSHVAINKAGVLYLAVNDEKAPGVRIFDTAQVREITSEPLRVGDLPPVWIVFVE